MTLACRYLGSPVVSIAGVKATFQTQSAPGDGDHLKTAGGKGISQQLSKAVQEIRSLPF